MTSNNVVSPYGATKLRAKARFILRDRYSAIEKEKGELTDLWGDRRFSEKQLQEIIDYNPERAAQWGRRRRVSEEMKNI